ncbi:MAG: EF-P lysine aminoacylase EpmA [Myxococcales bacterium]
MSPSVDRRSAAFARRDLYRVVRDELSSRGYLEVETPCLLSAPGMEPHLTAFESSFRPEMPGPGPRTLYLQTSPEYASKRLLAEGFGHVFQICKCFRNGEVSAQHNPEFTLLELYRSPGSSAEVRADLEALLHRAAAEHAMSSRPIGPRAALLARPYEVLTVRDAVFGRTGIDLHLHRDGASLRAAGEAHGHRFAAGVASYEDVFFQIFLESVERTLGVQQPTFLVDYPAPLAALAELRPGDPPLADRFELYAAGVELANGFGELRDEREQRRRLVAEQAQRRAAGRPAYPIDERFLAAVGRMPPSGGVALGLDRVLMLLLGAERIDDVLLFPASSEWA